MIVNGEVIKVARNKRGMTQAMLAQDICHQSMISRLEKGNHITSLTMLQQICDRLHVDLGKVLRLGQSYVAPLTAARTAWRELDYKQMRAILSTPRFEEQIPENGRAEYHFLWAVVEHADDRIESAMRELQMALALVDMNQKVQLLEIRTELAAVFRTTGEANNAKTMINLAFQAMDSMDELTKSLSKEEIAITFYRSAQIKYTTGQFTEAMYHMKQAVSYGEGQFTYPQLVDMQLLRAKIAERLKTTAEAYDAVALAYAAAKFSASPALQDSVREYQYKTLKTEE